MGSNPSRLTTRKPRSKGARLCHLRNSGRFPNFMKL